MIRIRQFQGRVPRLTRRALPDSAATVASSVWLTSGGVRRLAGLKRTLAVSGMVAHARSLWRYRSKRGEAETAADHECWFAWPRVTDAVRSPTPGDAWGRVYWTADGESGPRMTHAGIHGVPAGAAAEPRSVPMGVPAPAAAIRVALAAPPQPDSADALYALSSNFLYEANPATGAAESLGVPGFEGAARAMCAHLGKIYVASGASRAVYRVDVDDPSKTEFVGRVGLGNTPIVGLASLGGNLYAADAGNANSNLYTVSVGAPATGAGNLLATSLIDDDLGFECVSLAAMSGRLWALSDSGSLYSLVPGSGNAPQTLVGTVRLDGNADAIAAIPDEGLLVVSSAQTLWRVSTTDATAELRTAAPTGRRFDAMTFAALRTVRNLPVEHHAWVHTYVTPWGAEGPPSTPTAAYSRALVGDGSAARFQATTLTFEDEAPAHVRWRRVYRTVTGSTGQTTFRLVDFPHPVDPARRVTDLPVLDYHGQLPGEPGDPAAAAARSGTELVRAMRMVVDTSPNSALGEALVSTLWDPPPTGLRGLVAMGNGMLAGHVGRTLYVCEPYQPHAWPRDNAYTTQHDVVALASFGTSLVVATTAFPYVLQGVRSDSLSLRRVPFPQACVAPRTLAPFGDGVAYASPDGLVLVGERGATLATEALFARADWRRELGLDTDETLDEALGFQHDGAYMLFLEEGGMALSPDLSGVANFPGGFDGGAVDAEADALHLLRGNMIWEFGAGE